MGLALLASCFEVLSRIKKLQPYIAAPETSKDVLSEIRKVRIAQKRKNLSSLERTQLRERLEVLVDQLIKPEG